MDEGEFAAHRGLCHADLGDGQAAVRLLQHAIETCPPRRRAARFIYLAQLLRCLLEAGAWPDAEAVMVEAMAYAAEVGSGRTLRVLHDGLAIAGRSGPPSLRDAAHHFASTLAPSR